MSTSQQGVGSAAGAPSMSQSRPENGSSAGVPLDDIQQATQQLLQFLTMYVKKHGRATAHQPVNASTRSPSSAGLGISEPTLCSSYSPIPTHPTVDPLEANKNDELILDGQRLRHLVQHAEAALMRCLVHVQLDPDRLPLQPELMSDVATESVFAGKGAGQRRGSSRRSSEKHRRREQRASSPRQQTFIRSPSPQEAALASSLRPASPPSQSGARATELYYTYMNHRIPTQSRRSPSNPAVEAATRSSSSAPSAERESSLGGSAATAEGVEAAHHSYTADTSRSRTSPTLISDPQPLMQVYTSRSGQVRALGTLEVASAVASWPSRVVQYSLATELTMKTLQQELRPDVVTATDASSLPPPPSMGQQRKPVAQEDTDETPSLGSQQKTEKEEGDEEEDAMLVRLVQRLFNALQTTMLTASLESSAKAALPFPALAQFYLSQAEDVYTDLERPCDAVTEAEEKADEETSSAAAAATAVFQRFLAQLTDALVSAAVVSNDLTKPSARVQADHGAYDSSSPHDPVAASVTTDEKDGKGETAAPVLTGDMVTDIGLLLRHTPTIIAPPPNLTSGIGNNLSGMSAASNPQGSQTASTASTASSLPSAQEVAARALRRLLQLSVSRCNVTLCATPLVVGAVRRYEADGRRDCVWIKEWAGLRIRLVPASELMADLVAVTVTSPHDRSSMASPPPYHGGGSGLFYNALLLEVTGEDIMYAPETLSEDALPLETEEEAKTIYHADVPQQHRHAAHWPSEIGEGGCGHHTSHNRNSNNSSGSSTIVIDRSRRSTMDYPASTVTTSSAIAAAATKARVPSASVERFLLSRAQVRVWERLLTLAHFVQVAAAPAEVETTARHVALAIRRRREVRQHQQKLSPAACLTGFGASRDSSSGGAPPFSSAPSPFSSISATAPPSIAEAVVVPVSVPAFFFTLTELPLLPTAACTRPAEDPTVTASRTLRYDDDEGEAKADVHEVPPEQSMLEPAMPPATNTTPASSSPSTAAPLSMASGTGDGSSPPLSRAAQKAAPPVPGPGLGLRAMLGWRPGATGLPPSQSMRHNAPPSPPPAPFFSLTAAVPPASAEPQEGVTPHPRPAVMPSSEDTIFEWMHDVLIPIFYETTVRCDDEVDAVAGPSARRATPSPGSPGETKPFLTSPASRSASATTLIPGEESGMDPMASGGGSRAEQHRRWHRYRLRRQRALLGRVQVITAAMVRSHIPRNCSGNNSKSSSVDEGVSPALVAAYVLLRQLFFGHESSATGDGDGKGGTRSHHSTSAASSVSARVHGGEVERVGGAPHRTYSAPPITSHGEGRHKPSPSSHHADPSPPPQQQQRSLSASAAVHSPSKAQARRVSFAGTSNPSLPIAASENRGKLSPARLSTAVLVAMSSGDKKSARSRSRGGADAGGSSSGLLSPKSILKSGRRYKIEKLVRSSAPAKSVVPFRSFLLWRLLTAEVMQSDEGPLLNDTRLGVVSSGGGRRDSDKLRHQGLAILSPMLALSSTTYLQATQTLAVRVASDVATATLMAGLQAEQYTFHQQLRLHEKRDSEASRERRPSEDEVQRQRAGSLLQCDGLLPLASIFAVAVVRAAVAPLLPHTELPPVLKALATKAYFWPRAVASSTSTSTATGIGSGVKKGAGSVHTRSRRTDTAATVAEEEEDGAHSDSSILYSDDGEGHVAEMEVAEGNAAISHQRSAFPSSSAYAASRCRGLSTVVAALPFEVLQRLRVIVAFCLLRVRQEVLETATRPLEVVLRRLAWCVARHRLRILSAPLLRFWEKDEMKAVLALAGTAVRRDGEGGSQLTRSHVQRELWGLVCHLVDLFNACVLLPHLLSGVSTPVRLVLAGDRDASVERQLHRDGTAERYSASQTLSSSSDAVTAAPASAVTPAGARPASRVSAPALVLATPTRSSFSPILSTALAAAQGEERRQLPQQQQTSSGNTHGDRFVPLTFAVHPSSQHTPVSLFSGLAAPPATTSTPSPLAFTGHSLEEHGVMMWVPAALRGGYAANGAATDSYDLNSSLFHEWRSLRLSRAAGSPLPHSLAYGAGMLRSVAAAVGGGASATTANYSVEKDFMNLSHSAGSGRASVGSHAISHVSVSLPSDLPGEELQQHGTTDTQEALTMAGTTAAAAAAPTATLALRRRWALPPMQWWRPSVTGPGGHEEVVEMHSLTGPVLRSSPNSFLTFSSAAPVQQYSTPPSKVDPPVSASAATTSSSGVPTGASANTERSCRSSGATAITTVYAAAKLHRGDVVESRLLGPYAQEAKSHLLNAFFQRWVLPRWGLLLQQGEGEREQEEVKAADRMAHKQSPRQQAEVSSRDSGTSAATPGSAAAIAAAESQELLRPSSCVGVATPPSPLPTVAAVNELRGGDLQQGEERQEEASVRRLGALVASLDEIILACSRMQSTVQQGELAQLLLADLLATATSATAAPAPRVETVGDGAASLPAAPPRLSLPPHTQQQPPRQHHPLASSHGSASTPQNTTLSSIPGDGGSSPIQQQQAAKTAVVASAACWRRVFEEQERIRLLSQRTRQLIAGGGPHEASQASPSMDMTLDSLSRGMQGPRCPTPPEGTINGRGRSGSVASHGPSQLFAPLMAPVRRSSTANTLTSLLGQQQQQQQHGSQSPATTSLVTGSLRGYPLDDEGETLEGTKLIEIVNLYPMGSHAAQDDGEAEGEGSSRKVRNSIGGVHGLFSIPLFRAQASTSAASGPIPYTSLQPAPSVKKGEEAEGTVEDTQELSTPPHGSLTAMAPPAVEEEEKETASAVVRVLPPVSSAACTVETVKKLTTVAAAAVADEGPSADTAMEKTPPPPLRHQQQKEQQETRHSAPSSPWRDSDAATGKSGAAVSALAELQQRLAEANSTIQELREALAATHRRVTSEDFDGVEGVPKEDEPTVVRLRPPPPLTIRPSSVGGSALFDEDPVAATTAAAISPFPVLWKEGEIPAASSMDGSRARSARQENISVALARELEGEVRNARFRMTQWKVLLEVERHAREVQVDQLTKQLEREQRRWMREVGASSRSRSRSQSHSPSESEDGHVPSSRASVPHAPGGPVREDGGVGAVIIVMDPPGLSIGDEEQQCGTKLQQQTQALAEREEALQRGWQDIVGRLHQAETQLRAQRRESAEATATQSAAWQVERDVLKSQIQDLETALIAAPTETKKVTKEEAEEALPSRVPSSASLSSYLTTPQSTNRLNGGDVMDSALSPTATRGDEPPAMPTVAGTKAPEETQLVAELTEQQLRKALAEGERQRASQSAVVVELGKTITALQEAADERADALAQAEAAQANFKAELAALREWSQAQTPASVSASHWVYRDQENTAWWRVREGLLLDWTSAAASLLLDALPLPPLPPPPAPLRPQRRDSQVQTSRTEAKAHADTFIGTPSKAEDATAARAEERAAHARANTALAATQTAVDAVQRTELAQFALQQRCVTAWWRRRESYVAAWGAARAELLMDSCCPVILKQLAIFHTAADATERANAMPLPASPIPVASAPRPTPPSPALISTSYATPIRAARGDGVSSFTPRPSSRPEKEKKANKKELHKQPLSHSKKQQGNSKMDTPKLPRASQRQEAPILSPSRPLAEVVMATVDDPLGLRYELQRTNRHVRSLEEQVRQLETAHVADQNALSTLHNLTSHTRGQGEESIVQENDRASLLGTASPSLRTPARAMSGHGYRERRGVYRSRPSSPGSGGSRRWTPNEYKQRYAGI